MLKKSLKQCSSFRNTFSASSFFEILNHGIECFHMTSRRPYWCPKTMKRRPCWCPKPVLWELNSFLMQTLSFVPIDLHTCWPREWKYSIEKYIKISLKKSHLVTYAFSSKRWKFKGKIKLISKLMANFQMFLEKKKEKTPASVVQVPAAILNTVCWAIMG